MISVMGGIFFTVLFIDYTRYLSATNAVEQAARATARCITPTDPDCVSLASSANTVDNTWIGFRTAVESNKFCR